jgi:hypothetical protein
LLSLRVGYCRLIAGCSPPVRRLALALPVTRNDAETVIPELADSRNGQQELPVRSRRLGWLAWSLWDLTMALEVAAVWLWLGNRSLGSGYFAPQVFLDPAPVLRVSLRSPSASGAPTSIGICEALECSWPAAADSSVPVILEGRTVYESRAGKLG